MFDKWTFGVEAPDAAFAAEVPAGYEHMPIVVGKPRTIRRRHAPGGRRGVGGPLRRGATSRAGGRPPQRQVIAHAIAETPGLRLETDVETNLIWFEIDPDLGTANDVEVALKRRGVLVHGDPPRCAPARTWTCRRRRPRQAEVIRQAVPRLTPAR